MTSLRAWCKNPLPAKARRDAMCCSVRCRQARHRFLRAVGYAEAVAPGRPLRLAYADPPYRGRAPRRPYVGALTMLVKAPTLVVSLQWDVDERPQ